MDVYCVEKNAYTINVYSYSPRAKTTSLLASTQMRFVFTSSLYSDLPRVASHTYSIVSLLAADLNGDSMVDTVVVFKAPENRVEAHAKYSSWAKALFTGVFWGNNNNFSDFQLLPFTLANWPLVTKWFAHHAALNELFGCLDVDGGQPAFISFNKTRSVSLIKFNGSDIRLDTLKPSAYVDVTDDLRPDLVLSLKNDEFQVWTLEPNKSFTLISQFSAPHKAKKKLPSLFVDFSAKGRPTHLLPVCLDSDCSTSTIMARSYDDEMWVDLGVNMSGLRFVSEMATTSTVWSEKVSEPARILKVADVNLDGFPDLLAVMLDAQRKLKAVILENVKTSSNVFGRSFTARTIEIPGTSSNSEIALATFFDYNENGYPDILACYANDLSKRKEHEFNLIALHNEADEDTYFLKVTVLGSCAHNGDQKKCSSRYLPYGDNWPGSTIIVTVNIDESHSYRLFGSQMSQGNAHFALSTPYVTFGLGNTPNFVENIRVASSGTCVQPSSISNPVMLRKAYYRDWPQMIPNSHIVVVIYPPDSPETWRTHLYVTPSRLLVHTGIALAIICIAIAILVLALHLKEKKADKEERKLDVRRFRYEAL